MTSTRSLHPLTLGAAALIVSLLGGCGPEATSSSPRTQSGAKDLQPDADNSPAFTELAFVSRLGLVDGTNCEEWPKDFQFGDSYPSGVSGAGPEEVSPPLASQIPGALTLQRAGFMMRVQQRLADLGLERATTFGSKYSFEIRSILNPSRSAEMAVALDAQTMTGYALSREWVCTEAMAKAGGCILYRFDLNTHTVPEPDPEADPSDPDPNSYAILVRSAGHSISNEEIRDDRFLSVISAPRVTVRGGVILDTDTLVVTDRFSNTGTWAFEPMVELPRLSPPSLASLGEVLAFEPQQGFLGVVADELLTLDAKVLNGGGSDALVVDALYMPAELPMSRTHGNGSTHTRNVTRMHPQDLMEVSVQTLQPLPRVELSNLEKHGSLGDGTSEWHYRARSTRDHETVVTLRPRHAMRHRSTAPTPVLIACQRGPACESAMLQAGVQRYSSPPLRLEHLDLEGLFESQLQSALEPLMLSGQCTGMRVNPAGGFYQHSGGSYTFHFIDGRKLDCSSFAQCDGLARSFPMQLDECKRHDTARVCLERGGTSPSCINKENYVPAQRTAWLSDLRDEVEDDLPRHYFGPQTMTSDLPSVGALSSDISLAAPTLPLAALLTRGIYFELLRQGIQNMDLRTGEISQDWRALETRVSVDFPVDPDTGEDFDLSDFARMSEAWSLRRPMLDFTLARAAQARINDALGYGANALGLPFGKIAGGWLLPESAAGSNLFLKEVQDRWTDVAVEVERLEQVVRSGNIAGSIAAHAQAGRSLSDRIHAAARVQRQALEDQVASVQATADRLDELRLQLETHFSDYKNGMSRIWGCDVALPDGQAGSCSEVISSDVSALYNQCVAQSASTTLSDILSLAGDLAGAFGPIFDAVGGIQAQLAQGAVHALDIAPAAARLDGAADFILGTFELAGKVKKAIDSANKIAKFVKAINKLVDSGGYCDDTAPAYVNLRTYQATLQSLAATMSNYSLQLAQLEALLSRFGDDVSFYQTNRDVLRQLEAEAERLRNAYEQAAQAQGDEAQAMGLFVRNACPLARAAVDISLRDIYRANQTVATTSGDSFVKPHFYVPADPGSSISTQSNSPSWRANPTEHGFLYSLWDTSRFRNRIFDGLGASSPRDTIIKTLVDRMEFFKTKEVCRAGMPRIPNGLALLEKRIDDETLDAFLGRGHHALSTGRLDFTVSWDDLGQAFAASSPNLNVSKIFDTNTGHWEDLSAPVVLGVYYAVERPSGNLHFTSPAGNALWAPGLAAPKTSWVPTAACTDGEVRTSERFSWMGQDSVAVACLESVQVPLLAGAALAHAGPNPPALLNSYQALSAPTGSFCSTPQALLIPTAVTGRPAMGTWTLAFDAMQADAVAHEGVTTAGLGPDPAWLAANQDVEAVTLYFILGAETLAHNEPPRSRIEHP